MSTFGKISLEEVKAANAEPVLAPGYHPAILVIQKCTQSKGGMPMLVVDIRPLAGEGNRASGVSRLQQRKWVTLPIVENLPAYLKNLENKMASDATFAEKYAELEGEELATAALKTHREVALTYGGDIVNIARVVLGTEVVPYAPTYDKSRKTYVDESGNTFNKDEVDNIKLEITLAAVEALAQEIAIGDLEGVFDVVIFKSEKKDDVYVYAELPPGKVFEDKLTK
jgi:hypothetical protein